MNIKIKKVTSLKREVHSGKHKIKDLAKKYKITTMQVTRIARGDSWPNILPGLTRKKLKPKYTSAQTKRFILKELKRNKLYQTEIADMFKVTPTIVSRLKKKHLLSQ